MGDLAIDRVFEMPINPLSSQGPAARKPVAVIALGSSGYETSPATCSTTKRP